MTDTAPSTPTNNRSQISEQSDSFDPSISLLLDPSTRPPYDASRYQDASDDDYDTSLGVSFSETISTHEIKNHAESSNRNAGGFDATIEDESEPEDLVLVASPDENRWNAEDSLLSETPRPARLHSLLPSKPAKLAFPTDAPVKHVTIDNIVGKRVESEDWFESYEAPQAAVGLWDSGRIAHVAPITVTPSSLLIPNSILVESVASKALGTFLKGLSIGASRCLKRQVGYLIGHLRVVQRQESHLDSQLVLWINRFDPGTWNQSASGLHLSPANLDEDSVAVAVWDSCEEILHVDGDATSLGQYHIVLSRQGPTMQMRFLASCPDMHIRLEAVPTPRLAKLPDFSVGMPEWGYIITSAGRSARLVSRNSRPVLSQQVSPVGVWIESSGKSDLESRYSISNRNLRRLVRRAGALAQPHPLLSLLQDKTKPTGTMIVAIADASLPECADFWECHVDQSTGVTIATASWQVVESLDGLSVNGQLDWTISVHAKPSHRLPPLPVIRPEQQIRTDQPARMPHRSSLERPPPMPSLQPRQSSATNQNQANQQDAMQLLVQLFSTLANAFQRKPAPPSILSVDDTPRYHDDTVSEIDVGDSASQVVCKQPDASVIAALVHDDAEQSFVLPLTSHRPHRPHQSQPSQLHRHGVAEEADRLARRYLASEETIHEGYSVASLDYLKRWNLLR